MYTLLWYPKCSTCQKAKKFLEAKKINFTLRNIVEEVPQIDELKEWILQITEQKIYVGFHEKEYQVIK